MQQLNLVKLKRWHTVWTFPTSNLYRKLRMLLSLDGVVLIMSSLLQVRAHLLYMCICSSLTFCAMSPGIVVVDRIRRPRYQRPRLLLLRS